MSIPKHLCASILLFIQILGLSLFSTFSVLATEVKSTAPERYVVKKGDTLWGISGNYLNEPWRWPELWVKNTQIDNPHLIYPGDVIVLSFVDGQPVLSIEKQKQKFVLTPETKKKDKSDAISLLPWELLQPYVGQSWIVAEENYKDLPKVLGNGQGSVTFANNDLLLTKQSERSEDQYYIVRDLGMILDMSGNTVGYQLNHMADAEILVDTLESEWLARVKNNKQEVRRGDLLYSSPAYSGSDLELKPVENISGHILGGLEDHVIYGKFDVVIVDLGSIDVSPGSVMGIYEQGPDIADGEQPEYVDKSDTAFQSINSGTTIQQPALKQGELIVFSVFENASYGIITRSTKSIRRGFLVGAP